MFWRRKPQRSSVAPATVDEALVALPPGYRWQRLSCMSSGWYASVECKDGWAYSNFEPARCFPSPLAALQDAVSAAWNKYESMDKPKESHHA